MQEDYLLKFCNSHIKKSFKIIPDPYWTTKVYSLGKYLREYGYYPSWLPLCVYIDHGVVCSEQKPFKHELESDAPVQLVHAPRSKIEWEKHSKKPCFIMFSPFVFYRRKHKIVPSADAKGTIAFPAHSTPSIDDVSNIEIYIKQLLDLSEKFHPVSVCLHMHDINKGKHHIFIKNKIQVHTAGNIFDEGFAERFYDIIKNYKYATSNMAGSYIHYCIEMNINFFIYGDKQKFININDSNLPNGVYEPYNVSKGYRKLHDMFSDFSTQITTEQKNYIETSLGIKDGLTRIQMAYVLYYALFKWIFSGTFIKYFNLFLRNFFNKLTK